MMPIFDTRFRLRRDTAANWAAVNPVPLDGEPCIETDTQLRKTGDGSTRYSDLLYIISGEFDALADIADGQVPVWDGTNKRWKVGAGAGGSAYTAGYGIDIDDSDPAAPIIGSTLGSIALKNRVSLYGDLPSTGNVNGDAIWVDDDSQIYIWNGTWQAQGNGIQLNGTSLTTGPRWWRLKITEVMGGGAVANIGELEMYTDTIAGSTNRCTGGTAFADSVFGTNYAAANAFDGTKPTTEPPYPWASSTAAMPHYLGYKLASSLLINSVQIWPSGASGGASQWPKAFTVQSSGNSTTGLDGTWRDEWLVSGISGWTIGVGKKFDRP